MQTDEEIAATLTGILRANLNNSALEVTPQTVAATVPGWDSIKMVDIILDSEDAFAIRLDAEDLDRLDCVGDLIAAIQARLRAA